MLRLTVNISDDLKSRIDEASEFTHQTQSEIVRKALILYLAAAEGMKNGRKLGLVHPETGVMETHIVTL